MPEYLGIKIDYNRDQLLSDFSKKLLEGFYLHKDEASPQEAFARAAVAYCYGDTELAQRIYDYASRLWFMFATPVLANAPKPGEESRGLPISCFVTYVPDTVEGLIDHSVELRWLSVLGGGVGGYWGDVRSVSDIAPGPIPFIHTVDSDIQAWHQGKSRRGSYAAYLDVSHPDLIEFLGLRTPTGDANRKCLAVGFHHAVNITDDFMYAVYEDEEWNLVDPNDKTVRATYRAREIWERILETRFKTGEPYLCFIDTANKYLHPVLKFSGLKINSSQLCSEIFLPTNEERTAVCCLSSVNLEFYERWCKTQMISDLIYFLDNVLQHFIDNAPNSLSKAKYSAERERSLGLGAMGFHSFLQSKDVPFESPAAIGWNKQIFSYIQREAKKATKRLGVIKTPFPDAIPYKGYTGVRNSHLTAIAPNANNSIIAGTSPSIELYPANSFTQRTRAGSCFVKNKHLEKVLEKYGKNDQDTWSSIIQNRGSVQHLDFLSDHEKSVFKTAFEVDQHWVIQHAADRQPYICQGQSVNLFFPSGSKRSYVNSVHLQGWKKGLKSLYYLRTERNQRGENIGQKVKLQALGSESEDCVACEG